MLKVKSIYELKECTECYIISESWIYTANPNISSTDNPFHKYKFAIVKCKQKYTPAKKVFNLVFAQEKKYIYLHLIKKSTAFLENG